jgi:DNA-binding response OmpR family regulator
MLSSHILLVDDDPLLRRSVAFSLERAGYRVSTAANAEDALGLADRDPPDLVLLDIGLPGLDGLDALQRFQGRPHAPPVIFVTARRRELEQVLGLELGADDYITKPFDMDVLLAHIKAVLRRVQQPSAPTPEPQTLTVGDLILEPRTHQVTVADRIVELTRREFDLLYAMALEPGRIQSSEDLLARVWGAEFRGEPQVVYVHARWLREKLEEEPSRPRRIITVRGLGYRLERLGD